MKILAVSDVEESLLASETKRIAGIDLIVSCGDLNESYLSYLSTIYGVPLLFVRGNHDLALTPEIQLGENLHQRLFSYKNLRFLGFEGSIDYTTHAVQYTEAQMAWMVRLACLKTLLHGRPDIIVTHAPPRGIHDGADRCHQGFQSFHQLVNRLQPRYFLHGHIHLNYQRNLPRVTQVQNTRIVNVYGHYVFEV
ncbi:Icc-related predicted phosphoesterase [Hydrogenispora ethanolica]|uniref:Icc-related predicted phosphoesterase n=1 Tax=Hydrogenispora ethanolica TaxID=1082276 RepID=A0A4R1RNL8_HYDET|nr:metallophosphoesterase family protein [Hydrogenispora ethanolica]TCL67442.1 Icc-related predicted phosphoesterase [Hydrogenispora ethanolica]